MRSGGDGGTQLIGIAKIPPEIRREQEQIDSNAELMSGIHAGQWCNDAAGLISLLLGLFRYQRDQGVEETAMALGVRRRSFCATGRRRHLKNMSTDFTDDPDGCRCASGQWFSGAPICEICVICGSVRERQSSIRRHTAPCDRCLLPPTSSTWRRPCSPARCGPVCRSPSRSPACRNRSHQGTAAT